jgi:hypothetical protein
MKINRLDARMLPCIEREYRRPLSFGFWMILPDDLERCTLNPDEGYSEH